MPSLSSSQWLFDYSNNIIYFHQNPLGHTVETSVLNTFFTPNVANNLTVENLTIEGFATQIIQGGAIDPAYGATSSPSAGLNWTVQNNYVTLNHGQGIRAGFGMRALNNVTTYNGNFGLGGGCRPAILRRPPTSQFKITPLRTTITRMFRRVLALVA